MTRQLTATTDQPYLARRQNWTNQLARHALMQPDATALRYLGHTTTWAEFDRRITALANALSSRGVRFGDRVMILMLNRPEFVEATLAANQLGAIAVPVNFRLTPPELAFLVQDCEAAGGSGFIQKHGDTLTSASKNWPAPKSKDWKGACSPEKQQQRREENARGWDLPEEAAAFHLSGTTSKDGEASPPTSSPRRLNPRFVEGLMGLPEGWVSLTPRERMSSGCSATESFPKWLRERSLNFFCASVTREEIQEALKRGGESAEELDQRLRKVLVRG